jgi:transposase
MPPPSAGVVAGGVETITGEVIVAATAVICQDIMVDSDGGVIGTAVWALDNHLNVVKGLNRSILDTSPGMFFELLAYKAEDAGIPYIEVPARKVKPSQTCSSCGHVEKKQLADRVHDCKRCGIVLDRDANAAQVILNFARTGQVAGREPALSVESEVTCSLKHETPPIPEHAL